MNCCTERCGFCGRCETEPESAAGEPYICTVCAWTGRTIDALEHHVNTGHDVRGRRWPESWPNAQFSGDDRRKQQRKSA